jgi:hypothetical protein
VVNVFAREVTDDLASLAKQLDELWAKHEDKQFRAYFTFLTDDPDALEPKLKELAEKHQIKNVPLTIFDGAAGPPQYNISDEADVTVLKWERARVQVNKAYGKGKFNKDAVKQVVSAVEESL